MNWIDPSFVLLDAAQTVRDARRRLALHPSAHWVIVRRGVGAKVYWYSFPLQQALARMEPHGPAETVETALDLHEWRSVESHPRRDLERAHPQPGDVVLGAPGAPAGVFAPPMQAAARPAAGPAPEAKPLAKARPIAKVKPVAKAKRFAKAKSAAKPKRFAKAKPITRVRRVATMRKMLAPAPDLRPPKIPMRRTIADIGRHVLERLRRSAPAAAPARRGRGTTPAAAAPRGGRGPAREAKPFEAWPDIEAPASIPDGDSFTLEVGFSSEQVKGVVGGKVTVLLAPDEFDMDLVITAPGFRCAKGWRHTLRVDRNTPEAARLELKLTAAAGAWPKQLDALQRVIGVVYEYKGEVCGMAQRSIVIVRRGATLDPADLEDNRAVGAKALRTLPGWVRDGVPRADLTVALTRYDGNAARSNFVWSFHSPHDVPLPKPVPVRLQDDAASFARAITKDIVELGDAASPLIARHVTGAGRRISDHVPAAMWRVLASVAALPAVRKRVPDVLFLTEEWCIPWELALMPKPLDRDVVACLGAQVNLGRWILGGPAADAQPGTELDVHRMVVLYGDYPKDEDKLPEAIVERNTLVKKDGATAVPLEDAQVDRVLEGDRPRGGSQLLHFACHGVGDPQDPGNTHLLLESGAPLTDDMLRAARVGEEQHPFLFLNACEAGTAGHELDMASGFVGSAIQAGFRGCVGALWSVASDTARSIALDFYDRTLRGDESVASALRATRAKFVARKGRVPDDTYLAYVFYGHPALRLRKAR